mmetsp:Transcript_120531/g.257368  ORF Transcript_120531/g.257368 Transcript_120531/m.257368 type:complete len:292 (+) Transcript_120531:1312-2187(+)
MRHYARCSQGLGLLLGEREIVHDPTMCEHVGRSQSVSQGVDDGRIRDSATRSEDIPDLEGEIAIQRGVGEELGDYLRNRDVNSAGLRRQALGQARLPCQRWAGDGHGGVHGDAARRGEVDEVPGMLHQLRLISFTSRVEEASPRVYRVLESVVAAGEQRRVRLERVRAPKPGRQGQGPAAHVSGSRWQGLRDLVPQEQAGALLHDEATVPPHAFVRRLQAPLRRHLLHGGARRHQGLRKVLEHLLLQLLLLHELRLGPIRLLLLLRIEDEALFLGVGLLLVSRILLRPECL